MCFELDSSPPVPVISGAAVSHDEFVLEAPAGNRIAAFVATPDTASDTGVVILPDVRGLYRFYEEPALRFAERGYAALALDYFGRTAGPARRGDEFEHRPHVEAVSPERVQLDVRAGVEHLTTEQNEAFEQALSDAGVEHELVVYEGAPHSFLDRKQEEFAAASDDAWQRTLDFVDRHS